mmetsp:Transcript_6067/g.17760  ORF Transcript_6067/g.17760 Transcript_6067/m.17760 type:complete len:254 (-) Transcript_6067:2814-3575(-)
MNESPGPLEGSNAALIMELTIFFCMYVLPYAFITSLILVKLKGHPKHLFLFPEEGSPSAFGARITLPARELSDFRNDLPTPLLDAARYLHRCRLPSLHRLTRPPRWKHEPTTALLSRFGFRLTVALAPPPCSLLGGAGGGYILPLWHCTLPSREKRLTSHPLISPPFPPDVSTRLPQTRMDSTVPMWADMARCRKTRIGVPPVPLLNGRGQAVGSDVSEQSSVCPGDPFCSSCDRGALSCQKQTAPLLVPETT